MNQTEIKQNADFLEIALEEIETGTVQYEMVEEVYHNLIGEIDG